MAARLLPRPPLVVAAAAFDLVRGGGRTPEEASREGSVSGLACNHYERFDEDFRLAASLGHRAQRISVEWSRLEPEEGRFDEREFDHYRAVCDSIRHHGMVPTVTLHHFTNPLWVECQGGWENPRIIDWLARFAERVGRALGNRVAVWWTINEPMIAPLVGYVLGAHPPEVRDLSRALGVARHTLRAHGAMYGALRGVVATDVPVGVVHNMPYFAPLDPDEPADRAEVEAQDRFMNQWYLDGIQTGRIMPPCGDGEEELGLTTAACWCALAASPSPPCRRSPCVGRGNGRSSSTRWAGRSIRPASGTSSAGSLDSEGR